MLFEKYFLFLCEAASYVVLIDDAFDINLHATELSDLLFSRDTVVVEITGTEVDVTSLSLIFPGSLEIQKRYIWFMMKTFLIW